MTTRCCRSVHAATCVAMLVLAVGPAAAQSSPQNLRPGAQEHLDRAEAAYGARDYDGALEELRAAYALDPRPDLVYAQAQAQRMAGRCADAIETYRAFLALRPPPIEAARAERHIARCGETLAAERPVPAPRQAGGSRATAPRERRFYQDGWGIVMTSMGIAGVGTGIGLLIAASSAEDTAAQATDYRSFLGRVDDVETLRLAGTIALAAGGALIALGVLHFALWVRRGRARAPDRTYSLQAPAIELLF